MKINGTLVSSASSGVVDHHDQKMNASNQEKWSVILFTFRPKAMNAIKQPRAKVIVFMFRLKDRLQNNNSSFRQLYLVPVVFSTRYEFYNNEFVYRLQLRRAQFRYNKAGKALSFPYYIPKNLRGNISSNPFIDGFLKPTHLKTPYLQPSSSVTPQNARPA